MHVKIVFDHFRSFIGALLPNYLVYLNSHNQRWYCIIIVKFCLYVNLFKSSCQSSIRKHFKLDLTRIYLIDTWWMNPIPSPYKQYMILNTLGIYNVQSKYLTWKILSSNTWHVYHIMPKNMLTCWSYKCYKPCRHIENANARNHVNMLTMQKLDTMLTHWQCKY